MLGCGYGVEGHILITKKRRMNLKKQKQIYVSVLMWPTGMTLAHIVNAWGSISYWNREFFPVAKSFQLIATLMANFISRIFLSNYNENVSKGYLSVDEVRIAIDISSRYSTQHGKCIPLNIQFSPLE